MRRHGLRRGLHHRIWNHLVVGAMYQHDRRTAIGETDAVGRQQRAGKADNRRRARRHAQPAMKAHHTALRKPGQGNSFHAETKLLDRSRHRLLDHLSGGGRACIRVGEVEPLAAHRIHRTGLGRIRHKESGARKPERHRIGEIGQILRVGTPAMHDHNQARRGTAACRCRINPAQRAETLHHRCVPELFVVGDPDQ